MSFGQRRRRGKPCAGQRTITDSAKAADHTVAHHLGAAWRIDGDCDDFADPIALERHCFEQTQLFRSWQIEHQHTTDRLVHALKERDGGADSSLPVEYRGWLYFDRWARGDDHVQHCRVPAGEADPSTSDRVQLLFDENALSRHRAHFEIGDWGISPCGNLVAWTADLTGDELCRLFVKDVQTGDMVDVSPPVCDAGFEWCETDSAQILYVVIDDDGRATTVKRHRVGDRDWSGDSVVYSELDEAWSVGVFKSRCERTLFVQSDCFDSNETWYLPSNRPDDALKLISAREDDVEYHVERQADHFVIMASIGEGAEFAIYECPIDDSSRDAWACVDRPDPGTTIETVEAFANYRLVTRRRGARVRVEIQSRTGDRTGSGYVDPEHPMGSVTLDENPDFAAEKFRFSFTSPVDGERTIEIDPRTRERKTLWEENPGEGYDASRYGATRIWAPAFDGERIPVSLVWRRDRLRIGGSPCLLRVYGAYEDIEDLELDTDRLGLLDAGMVYAIAHVRGGGEKGRTWYEAGRDRFKINSVRDYLSALDYLERTGWASPGQFVAHTESAGGIVVGAALNEAPEKFAGAVCEVPFVDMVNSLLDEELPTTLADRDEFGDPTNADELAAILQISPVDNVSRRPYPPILITLGINDPRVPAREGLRWASALRRRSTSQSPVLVLADVESGHHGPSGRIREIQRIAELQAFALYCVGLDSNEI